MATSGSFITSKYNSAKWLEFSWSVKSTDVANNKTTISYTLKGKGNDTTTWHYAQKFKLVINGKTVYSSSTKIKLYDGTKVTSGTLDIEHKADGTKTFSASAEAAIYTASVNCTGSKSFTLNTIDRKCVISAADGFAMNSGSPKVTFTNPTNGKMDSLTLAIKVYNYEGEEVQDESTLISAKTLTKTAKSYTFNFTSSEWNTIKNKVNNGNYPYDTTRVKYVLTTTFGSTSLTSTKTAKLSDASSATPTATLTVTENNAAVAACFPTSKKVIKGYSNISVALNPSFKYGATLNYFYFSNEYKPKNIYTTNNIGSWGGVFQNNWYNMTLVDSRARVKYYSPATLPEVEYFPPKANLRINSFTVNNEIVFTVSGATANFTTDGGQANNPTVQYRVHIVEEGFNPRSSDWGESAPWITLSPSITVSGNNRNYTATVTLDNMSYTENYAIQVKCADKITTTTAGFQYARKFPVFDFDDDGMRIYKPLSLKENVAIYDEGKESYGSWVGLRDGSYSGYGIAHGYVTSSAQTLSFTIPCAAMGNCGQTIAKADGSGNTTKYFTLNSLGITVRALGKNSSNVVTGGYIMGNTQHGSGTTNYVIFSSGTPLVSNGAATVSYLFDTSQGYADNCGWVVEKAHDGHALTFNLYFNNALALTTTASSTAETYQRTLLNNTPVEIWCNYNITLLN